MAGWGTSSINMALLTELSQSRISFKTAKDSPFLLVFQFPPDGQDCS